MSGVTTNLTTVNYLYYSSHTIKDTARVEFKLLIATPHVWYVIETSYIP